jgi:hypothetical protein
VTRPRSITFRIMGMAKAAKTMARTAVRAIGIKLKQSTDIDNQ